MLNKIPFRRIRWPGWVVLIVAGFFFVYGMTQLTAAIFSDSTGAVQAGIDFKMETENTDTYTISIEIPEIDERAIQEPILEWITKEKESFLKTVGENKKELGGGNRAHLFIQTDMKNSTEDTYSLLINSYQLVNNIKGEQHVKTFTINGAENRFLQLSDLLTINAGSINKIRAHIQEVDSMILANEKIDRVLQEPESWNWTLDQQALTLYLTVSDPALALAAPFQIEVPVEDIRPYLDEKVADAWENWELADVHEAAVESENKYVALTFDDGPDSTVTPRILNILKDHDVKATFFMLGSQVEKFPSLAKKVSEAGHEIGNHTDLHKDLTKLGSRQLLQEVLNSRQKIQEATGQTPSILRPPYGAVNQQVVEAAKENGSSIVLWSVDSLDWKNKNAAEINRVVQEEISPGSIILLHDVHPTTADSLPGLLTKLEAEGYQFMTVSQLRAAAAKESASLYYGNKS
ncbi:polysaccharide deacetylase family protein [Lysinibacillus sphaericus]